MSGNTTVDMPERPADWSELSRLRLFENVSLKSVRTLLDACPVREVRADETIIHAGQSNHAMYVLLSGRLHIHLDSVKSTPDAIIEAGESVGELSVLDEEPAAASVVAAEDARLLVVPREIFWPLIEASHGIARNLLFILVQRLRSNNSAIRRGEERVRLLLESTGEAIYGVDSDGICTFANRACLRMLGYKHVHELIGKNMHNLIHRAGPDNKAIDQKNCHLCQGFRENRDTHVDDETLWRKDCASFPAECWSSPIYRDGEVVGSVFTFVDIAERKRAHAERIKLSSAIEQAADSIIITGRNGIIEYVNPAFEQTTGFSREECLGRKPDFLKSGRHDKSFYEQMWKTIFDGQVFRDVFVNRKKTGDLYYEEKTVTPLTDDNGDITHFIATGKDITERILAQERVHYLVHHDALTDVPNRNLLMERLDQAVMHAHYQDHAVAVLFLDLDRFKVINDTLGHDAGDEVLQAVSERLRNCVRANDTVARLGGDEFALLITHIDKTKDIAPIARGILNVFSRPFKLSDREVFVTASMGISVYLNDSTDAATLLKHADIAMYQAKDQGKNNYRFYTSDMDARTMERLNLETALRRGLERREFLLHYQPKVNLDSGEIIGMEALIRWQRPELGLVSPLEFVPLLEETGLIVPVGEWVLESACQQAQAWKNAGIFVPNVAINLSARQFGSASLLAAIDQLCNEAELDPELLELEITESVLMTEGDSSMETLQALKGMGIKLAIDDFGTGYSSLAYLKRFPIDTLKIDRAFIKDLPTDVEDAAIVSAVIALAQGLGLNVVAEGVETHEQLQFLRSRQCGAAQGYVFGRPLPAEELTALLRTEKPFELVTSRTTSRREARNSG
ncbi:MAG: EAL domain-containing protein [Acidiferrobacterales bacterium]